MSQLIYVISEVHYCNDSNETHEEVIITFVNKDQAQRFIDTDRESEYPKYYNLTCVSLIS